MNKMCKISIVMAVLILSGIGIVNANPGSSATISTGVVVSTPPPPIVSINVSTNSINFGNLQPSQIGSASFDISNDGTVDVNVALKDNGMTGSNSSNIIPADLIVFSPSSPVLIATGNTKTEDASLTIPVGVASDTYSGTIDLTASEAA